MTAPTPVTAPEEPWNPNTCPHCGAPTLDDSEGELVEASWGDIGTGDQLMTQDVDCWKCGQSWTAYYEVAYTHIPSGVRIAQDSMRAFALHIANELLDGETDPSTGEPYESDIFADADKLTELICEARRLLGR